MNEQAVITALSSTAKTLKSLALVALDEDDPMAFPEPPEPGKIAEYEQHISTISAEVSPGHRPLLAASLRDYKAGFADRAGIYLLDFVKRLLQDPEYAKSMSPAGRQKIEACRQELADL
jgi:hypothetical protein